MSEHNYNLNNSYDYYQSLNEPNSNEKRRYDINTMTIPKRTKSPIVYDAGIDNYFVNEIKKAKYQGVFDPGSLGNKNIFLDSNKSNNKNPGINVQKKARKNNIYYNRLGEGKNLLIIKNETLYPINYGTKTINADVSYNQGLGKNIYNFNNYYIESRNNNYRNIYARSNDNKRNYLSPKNNEKKNSYLLNNNYQTKTINIEKLNRDYNKRFNPPKMTLYEKYSTNTVSFDNPVKNFSPTFAPNRNQNIFKQKAIKNINMSYSKKINDINNDNDFINNTYNFDNENNLDDYINKDYENKINIMDTETNKDIKLINIYRKKLLNLFIWHLKNFYKLQFKKIFSEVINIIKTSINNKEHNFENKTIKNIAMLKKELKNNSYYYGYNGQYNNLLKEVKIKKNIKTEFDNDIDNNEINLQNPAYLETDIINDDEQKEKNNIQNDFDMKLFSEKKNMNKKIFSGNNNLIKTDKKYTKKIVPKGVYGKKIIKQQFKKLSLVNSNQKNKENNIKINQKNRINEKTPIIHKRLNFPKSSINDYKIFNSGIKIIDNIKLENNNIKLEKENLENNINIKTNNNENNINTKDDYEIDKRDTYLIKSEYIEKQNIDEIDKNENEIENYSNKNLQNAITIITKVIENKEKSEKENKKEALNKIIIKINNKENNKILKKYFNKFKQEKNEILNEEPNININQDISNDIILKPKLKNAKKLKKNVFLSDPEDNEEHADSNIENNSYKSEDDDKNRSKRKKEKIRIIMKQIKIKKNIIDDYKNDIPKPKTPTNDNMKNVIQENNKTPKIIIKKTINIIFNKPDNNTPTKEEVKQEINENENKSEEKEINEAENKIEDNEIKETENKVEENEIYETKNKEEEKEIDERKDHIEEIDQLENIENKNENNLEKNLDINRINFSIEDSDKKLENKLDKEFSIETFTKYRKSKVKFIKNEEEEDSSNEQDITLTEKYQDCENFVYFLRTQLIYCFLANKNYDESFLD